jgi:membrane associated rhomboid family serine protease
MTLKKYIQSPAWRQDEILPTHDGNGWAVWKGRSIQCADIKGVTERIKGWHPLQPVLVGKPGSMHFIPPPGISQLRQTIDAFQRRSLFGIVAFLIGSCIFLAIALAMPSKGRAPIYAIMFLITLTVAVDYAANLRHAGPLLDRSLFYFWLQTSRSGRIGFLFWLVFGLVIGVVQLFMQRSLGSIDALVESYGLMFAPARAGEFWRFLTGPFFHSGIGHYLNNLFSLIFIGSIAWALFGVTSLAIFLVGSWLAGAAQMYLGTGVFDSYLGVSGGVFALYGLVVAAGVLNRRLLPQGFAMLCACVAIVTGVGSALLSTNTASVSHFSGTMAGAMCAAILLRPWFLMRQASE